MDYFKAQFQ